MGTGTRVAEDKSWEEVTSMEINPGTPRASPPPPGPQTQPGSALGTFFPFPKCKRCRARSFHQKSHHDWKLTVTEHDFNTLVLTNYRQKREACPT